MSPAFYAVTLRHDRGRVTVATWATSEEAAARVVCIAEGAPASAVVNVRRLRRE